MFQVDLEGVGKACENIKGTDNHVEFNNLRIIVNPPYIGPPLELEFRC